jgi:hypothetical protein
MSALGKDRRIALRHGVTWTTSPKEVNLTTRILQLSGRFRGPLCM